VEKAAELGVTMVSPTMGSVPLPGRGRGDYVGPRPRHRNQAPARQRDAASQGGRGAKGDRVEHPASQRVQNWEKAVSETQKRRFFSRRDYKNCQGANHAALGACQAKLWGFQPRHQQHWSVITASDVALFCVAIKLSLTKFHEKRFCILFGASQPS